MDEISESTAELEKAEKTLDAAKVLRDAGFYEDSLSRCYYSVLHSAKAALFRTGINTKTHDAVKRLFGKMLVERGIIEKGIRYYIA
ncbi:MAG: HEPN domain-containing protein [Spirochaetia bacterium]